MAVPYKAKSTLTANPDFAQNEVQITTTIISQCYKVVTKEQLKQTLNKLLASATREDDYPSWAAATKMDRQYRAVNTVNLDDHAWLERLYRHLSRCKGTIDYYLITLVFPREAKQFKYKLCKSAADLPRCRPGTFTAGFSGATDNSALFPRTIQRRNLPELSHTSAEVMATLLRPENRSYILAESNGNCLSTQELLKLVVAQKDHPISLLADVGAAMSDMENREIAHAWLSLADGKAAACFFDDKDRFSVVERAGGVTILASSPFRDRIKDCLIFIHEYHIFGTDLKLPDNWRPDLTIGPDVTP